MKKVTNIMFSVMFVLCFTLFLQNNVSGAQKIQVQFNANGVSKSTLSWRANL